MSASASLFDVSVWVALAFDAHPHHDKARAAFNATDSRQPAAFCRATQQSFLRIVTTPAIQKIYGSGAVTNEAAWEKYESLLALPQVVWRDEPAGLERHWQSLARRASASPKVWMDAYLAAFAIAGRMPLTTLDEDFKRFAGLTLRLLSRDS